MSFPNDFSGSLLHAKYTAKDAGICPNFAALGQVKWEEYKEWFERQFGGVQVLEMYPKNVMHGMELRRGTEPGIVISEVP